MRFIDKLKEWWDESSWEKAYNELAMEIAQDIEEQSRAREEKLKSYESMSERQLLIEIAKNTLKEVE